MIRSHSMLSFIFAIAITLQIFSVYAENSVPVLIWDGSTNSNLETSAVNPFLKTSQAEFSDIIMNIAGPAKPIALFLKDDLCIEQLTKNKEELRNITNNGQLTYLSAVADPLAALMDLPYNVTYDDNPDSLNNGEITVVLIPNIQGINEKYKAMKESNPNMVAVFTGRSCSYSRSERVKREVAVSNDTTEFLIRSERVLLYSSQPPFLKVSADKDFIQLPSKPFFSISGQGTKDDPLILRLSYSQPNEEKDAKDKRVLEFNFVVESAGYYNLKTVNYKDGDMTAATSLQSNTDIVFPFNFSYHCSHKTLFQNGSMYLNITDLQVQVDAKTFSDAYDCVCFTTIPIWTGLFVTAIIALIMIWGLTMIMDIRTMDRFDDPKGKTITISAQE